MYAFINRYVDLRAVGMFVLAVATVSCNGGGSQLPDEFVGGGTNYIQINRLGRPGLKMIFQPWADHDSTNRNNPYSDPTLPGEIASFMGGAGRSTAVATAVQQLLIPDEIEADLSQLHSGAAASYLGVESNGGTGSLFGGRALTDPAMETTLNLAFGNLITNGAGGFGVAQDDGAEQPCLVTDNLVPTSIASLDKEAATFPYLGTAR